MKNVLIAQSGGPTSAINATMTGVIQRALTSADVGTIYGALFGIKGVIDEQFKALNTVFTNPLHLNLLSGTPASALGSCRYKLDDDPAVYAKIVTTLRKYNIGYFVYIGGNDSMDTVLKLSAYCKTQGIDDIRVMGAPKTIDNDLPMTDHTPGFGSAAKYIAATISEVICDIRVYDTPAVTIVETMGRNTGWLAVASCLSGLNGGLAPHLIYLPEAPFDETAFIRDTKEALQSSPYVLVVVSEGVRDAEGEYLCEKNKARQTDVFGNITQLSGAGLYLENVVAREIGCKVRSLGLSLMQRCAAHLTSANDIEEARLLGIAALDRAMAGGSGEVPIIVRLSDKPYRFRIETTPVENVANQEKTVPLAWLNEKRNNVNQQMLDYLYPLIQGEVPVTYQNGIPAHIRLY